MNTLWKSLILTVICWAAPVPAVVAQTGAPAAPLSAELTPPAILHTMESAADWLLANPGVAIPAKRRLTDWTMGALDAGMMALAGISGDPKYLETMMRTGADTNQWGLGPRKFHADDHCIGQAYVELYLRYRDDRMLAPMRQRFDDILANPSTVQDMDFKQPQGRASELWSWCDALFMGPPAWLRLYVATGDQRYMDFAVTNWWRTSDYLYDKPEHLYFRDSTYFTKTEANGKKVFWSRGNGWVMGGLVRMLQYLPNTHPARERFVQQFREMADAVLACQQDDGLWRSSLLDAASYPLKETSGSGFFTYAFAWGVNQGVLDRARFRPAAEKGWRALVACVQPDGKLTHVQPIGADPKKFDENATETYGVGAFLLAGSEMYRMAVLPKTKSVTVTNPTEQRRIREMVELPWNDLKQRFPATSGGAVKLAVMDGVSSHILDSLTDGPGGSPERLLFQVDLAPKETRSYRVMAADALAALPKPIVKISAPEPGVAPKSPLKVELDTSTK